VEWEGVGMFEADSMSLFMHASISTSVPQME
jgi:hypothetical protein